MKTIRGLISFEIFDYKITPEKTFVSLFNVLQQVNYFKIQSNYIFIFLYFIISTDVSTRNIKQINLN